MTDHPTLTLRAAEPADLPLLGRLNRQLLDAERSRLTLDAPALSARMAAFLADGWQADLFLRGEAIVGYALYRVEEDPTEPSGRRWYLRQFAIAAEHRGQGLGRAALTLLARSRWPAGGRLVLDVLATNPAGLAFWTRMGLAPYAQVLEARTEALAGLLAG